MELFTDLEKDGLNWKIYGCSLGVDPKNEDVYMSLYHEFVIPTYITRRYSANGEILKEYDMIQNYWFPSNFVFPQDESSQGVSDITADNASGTIGFADGSINVSGAQGQLLQVYNSCGMIVSSARIDSELFSIPMPETPGMYIARAGKLTHKFIVR